MKLPAKAGGRTQTQRIIMAKALTITIRGSQGSGKTSLLKLLADSICDIGSLQRIRDDSCIEEAMIILDEPIELAKRAADVSPLKRSSKGHE